MGRTFRGDVLAVSSGEVEWVTQRQLHPHKERTVPAIAKAHKVPEKLFRELEMSEIIGDSPFILKAKDSYFVYEKLKISNLPGSPYFHVQLYEEAEFGFDKLRKEIFTNDSCSRLDQEKFRDAIRGIICGFAAFHDKYYTHGSIKQDAIRWTKDKNDRIRIKITDYGEAKRHKLPLRHKVFKDEVRQIAVLLKALAGPNANLPTMSGNANMLNRLVLRMSDKVDDEVPSLQMLCTSVLVMSSRQRLAYIHHVASTLRNDWMFCQDVIRQFNMTCCDSWKDVLPDFAASYILRKIPRQKDLSSGAPTVDPEKFKRECKQDTKTILKLAFKREINEYSECEPSEVTAEMLAADDKLQRGYIQFKLAYNAADLNFMLTNYYSDNLLDLLRLVRNFIAHYVDIDICCALSTNLHKPTTFLDKMLEKVVHFGTDLETLVYTVKHDRLLGTQELAGNQELIAEGRGCMFDQKFRDYREKKTVPAMANFKAAVETAVENSDLKLPDYWPTTMRYPLLMRSLQEVTDDEPFLNISNSSSEERQDDGGF